MNKNYHICVKEEGLGSCNGDSGGPLVTKMVKYRIIYPNFGILNKNVKSGTGLEI